MVKVVDSVTEAFEGATVTATLAGGSTYIFSSSVVTDVAGSFLIEQLPVGIYDLTVSAIDYVGSSVSGISVTAGVDTPIGTIGLVPIP